MTMAMYLVLKPFMTPTRRFRVGEERHAGDFEGGALDIDQLIEREFIELVHEHDDSSHSRWLQINPRDSDAG